MGFEIPSVDENSEASLGRSATTNTEWKTENESSLFEYQKEAVKESACNSASARGSAAVLSTVSYRHNETAAWSTAHVVAQNHRLDEFREGLPMGGLLQRVHSF